LLKIANAQQFSTTANNYIKDNMDKNPYLKDFLPTLTSIIEERFEEEFDEGFISGSRSAKSVLLTEEGFREGTEISK
jgi:hypothetical protein